MYVYIRSEPGLWTVGFYCPKGKWHPESDHNSRVDAAKRVALLNGIDTSTNQIIKEKQQALNLVGNITNHIFCDTICEPVCNRKKTLQGYEDINGVPCARNTCTLFNQFSNNVSMVRNGIKKS